METKGREIYSGKILNSIPRLLCMQDRDPTSPSYGCFDREYWAWCTKDFSNIDLQRGVFPLAFVYSTKFKGNCYYQNKKILEWIKAGVRYWCNAQHSDGSFDHLYPKEHSYMVTGFTLFEIIETLNLIKLDDTEKKKTMHHAEKAANFLVTTDESHGFLSNHRAGAACSLYNAYIITKKRQYKTAAQRLISEILEKQANDGWYLEYASCDPGYQTLCTNYLANYYLLSHDKILLKSLEKSIKFLQHFIHPNGTVGGEYGSRNTELYFPGGFEILAKKIPESALIANKMLLSIKDGECLCPGDMDDKNFVPFLSSYCFAVQNYAGYDFMSGKHTLPYEKEFTKFFPDSQLFITSTKDYYAILGVSKGGVLKVFDKKDLVYSNSGYSGVLKTGETVSSQMFSKKQVDISESKEATSVSMSSSFYYVPFRLMTPLRFFLFRAFNLTLGGIKPINYFVRRNFIIKKFVLNNKKADVKIRREFLFKKNEIKIKDVVESLLDFKSLKQECRFTTIFMASAKYFQRHDLAKQRVSREDYATQINKEKRVSVMEKILFK